MLELFYIATWFLPLWAAVRFSSSDYEMVKLSARQQHREVSTTIFVLGASLIGFFVGLVANATIHKLGVWFDPVWHIQLDSQLWLVTLLPIILTFLASLLGIRQQLNRLCPVE